MGQWIEIEDHTADAGIEIWAENALELFYEAGAAFSELSSIDYTDVGSSIHHDLTLEEDDLENLLHSFLNEALYLFDSQHFLANVWQGMKIISLPDGFCLTVTLHGGTFVHGDHEAGLHVKAITWHQLEVDQMEDGSWYARVIFDI